MNIPATEIIPDPQSCAKCRVRRAVVLHQAEDLKKRPVPLCAECGRPATRRLRAFLRKLAGFDTAVH